MTTAIGIIAAEFTPAIGGMEQHALGLARSLSARHIVTVYTVEQHAACRYDEAFAVRPVLRRDHEYDRARLESEMQSFWLVLNAGYAPLACALKAPVFVYCHGNDFLDPWIAGRPSHAQRVVERLARLPGGWRVTSKTRLGFRTRALSGQLVRGLSAARGIFVNSQFTRARLARCFPRLRTPVRISHPGIADALFEHGLACASNTRASREIRLVTITRLTHRARRKNIDNVIRAVALAANELDLKLQIVGDGELRSDLEALAVEQGVAERVTFLGRVTREEIVARIREADLFVLPAKSSERDIEGFGIVYAEAAAQGRPSLLSRAGGATDAVCDGLNGIVIEGAEPEDIAAGLAHFAARREAFDPAAIRQFARRFQWSAVAARLVEEIDDLLAGPARACSERRWQRPASAAERAARLSDPIEF